MDPRPVFDVNEQIPLTVVSGGDKHCVVRWPTDQEWADRSRKKRPVRHLLGRGKGKTEVPNFEQVDHELFQKIRIDKDGAEFDAFDASDAIGKLERFAVDSCERVGDQFHVAGKVRGIPVAFLVKIPTKRDAFEHSRASLEVIDARRQQLIRVALEPSGELFDRIKVSAEGYANGAVPIIHKDVVIDEVLRALADMENEEDPES